MTLSSLEKFKTHISTLNILRISSVEMHYLIHWVPTINMSLYMVFGHNTSHLCFQGLGLWLHFLGPLSKRIVKPIGLLAWKSLCQRSTDCHHVAPQYWINLRTVKYINYCAYVSLERKKKTLQIRFNIFNI